MHLPEPKLPLDPHLLGEIAAGLASSEYWRQAFLEGDGDRRFARLLETGAYDAWLIEWDPVSDLDLHDHGGSTGAFHIVHGTLIEQFADRTRTVPLREAEIQSGTSRSFGAARVHRVWNPGPAKALSVHVYSPPLTSMTFYSAEQGSFLEPIATLPVGAETPEPAGVR